MTNEERHIAVLNRMLESMDVYDSIQPTTERKKAIKAAIKALEQQPCEDEYIKVPKKALKYRTAGMVAYNAEWLKKHWQMELKVMGIECDDAISRQALLDLIEHYNSDGLGSVFYGYEEGMKFADAVNKLPPVAPQPKYEEWIGHR